MAVLRQEHRGRGQAILINLVVLTASSLALQGIGVVFQVFLVGKIGAAGIGLFQLVNSVYLLSMTVAASGVRFATTRLAAEELGRGSRYGAYQAVGRCLIYAMVFSITTMVVLLGSAQQIAQGWIGDGRTALSLRILAFSLPFFAGSAVLGGFFTAIQQMVPAAVVQVLGQLVRIGVTVGVLLMPATQGLEYSCAAIVLGTLAGEVFSCLTLLGFFLANLRCNQTAPTSTRRLTRRLLGIALPIAVSAYARTALSTLQQMLTPRGLRKSGASGEAALATYGIIHGMVFPILFLPSASVGVMAQLIVPELTESQVAGRTVRIDYIVNRVFRIGLFFATGVAGVLFFYAGELGHLIYRNPQAGGYLQLFAPLAVIMYLDTLVDGMLKGLGKQVASMGVNILDALSGVLLVYFLLPRYAIGGYVFAVFFTEILNFALSLGNLLSVANLRPKFWVQIRAVCCVLFARGATFLLLPDSLWGGTAPALVLRMSLTVLLYLLGLFLTDCLTREDFSWFRSLIRGAGD